MLFITGMLYAEPDKLPSVRLKDLDNNRVSLADYYKDGPIAINVWNLACEPCKKEMKYLDKFNQTYAELGFEVISINIDSPRSMSKVKSFVKSQKYSFTVLSDPRGEFFRKMGGKVMPYLIMVNPDGSIYKRHVGFNPGDEKHMEQEIKEMICLQSEEHKVLLEKLESSKKEKSE